MNRLLKQNDFAAYGRVDNLLLQKFDRKDKDMGISLFIFLTYTN